MQGVRQLLLIGLVAFAGELEGQLSAATALKLPATLIDQLERHIQSFPNNLGSTAATRYGDLDKGGTGLWNLCTRLKRKDGDNKQQGSLVLTMTRLYAFMLLYCAQNSGKGTFANGLRLMRVALKVAKSCLGTMRPRAQEMSKIPDN